MREVTRQRLPSKESLKSAAWAAREVPSAPKSVDKIDNEKDYIDPNDKGLRTKVSY